MKLENAQAIVEFLEDQGDEASVYEDYSGRGMYGRTTAGVVASEVSDVTYAMGRLGIEDSRNSDSMGRDVIVY
jgi:hypothetical protein